jgi:hypothetical protein
LRRALVLGAIVILLGAGCGGGGKVGAKALAQEATSLQSLAAEGALLAQDVTAGRTTRIYTREHSADLHKAAAQVESSLKKAKPAPGLEGQARALAGLATRVSRELELLGHASKDEARGLGHDLESAAAKSKKIGEGLG